MYSCPFYKFSPGGNTTILVPLKEFPTLQQRRSAACEMLDSLHLGAEQVGFIDLSQNPPHLEMMGGEFCGNASRSFAVVLAREGLLSPTQDTITVSGVKRPLHVSVTQERGLYSASVEMPFGQGLAGVSSLQPGLTKVDLDGIVHFLLDGRQISYPERPDQYLQQLCKTYSLQDRAAVGCIWYSETEEGAFTIRPVVWVRETKTTYCETACGSGTLALALASVAQQHANCRLVVQQPSGQSLVAEVTYSLQEKDIVSAWIGGPVSLIAQGNVFLQK